MIAQYHNDNDIGKLWLLNATDDNITGQLSLRSFSNERQAMNGTEKCDSTSSARRAEPFFARKPAMMFCCNVGPYLAIAGYSCWLITKLIRFDYQLPGGFKRSTLWKDWEHSAPRKVLPVAVEVKVIWCWTSCWAPSCPTTRILGAASWEPGAVKGVPRREGAGPQGEPLRSEALTAKN